jgi:hypothetical protein
LVKISYSGVLRDGVRWLVCVILLALPSPLAAEEPRAVLVLSSAPGRAREQVLVDALRIYTRDLGRVVRLGGAAPAALDPETLARRAEETREAEVLVWFGERGGVPVLYALRVATLDLRETTVDAEDPQQAARALALKVRALLTARGPSINDVWAVAAPAPTPSPTPEPSPEPPPAREPPLPPAPTPSPVAVAVAAQASPAPRARDRIEVEALYGAMVPTNVAWVRHGLTLRLSAPWGRLPVAVFADAAFTTAPTVSVDGHPVTARVWPVGVGVALRLKRPRWQISGGPRVSLQIIDATATAGSQSGSARRYSAGLGALGEGAWIFSRYVAAVASITVEALVPRRRFQAGGPGATDLGWVQFGFNAGLFVIIP